MPGDFEREQWRAEAHRIEMRSRRVFAVLLVLASSVPLWFLLQMVQSLAGTSTVLDVSISLAAVASVTICSRMNRKQLQSQHDSLVRLRARVEIYEGRREGNHDF